MGMSSSQARLLAITSRISDIEYKSQAISNNKIRLADESEQVANAYNTALNKQTFTYSTYNPQGQAVKYKLNSNTINNQLAGQIQLVSTNGKQVPSSYTESELYDMLESGEYILQSYQTQTQADGTTVTDWFNTNASSNVAITQESDDSQLAIAEAEYNAATAKIQKKEKILENDLKELDTEHSALTTEQDSIKSLIGDNVEKSFSLFS